MRGKRGAEDIRRNHSPEAAAEAIKERIEEGRRERLVARLQPPTAARASVGAPHGRDLLEHLLNFSEPPPAHGAGRLKASAKRLYLRLLRPYAAHQQRINISTAESLDEVREALVEVLRMDAEAEEKLAEGNGDAGAKDSTS